LLLKNRAAESGDYCVVVRGYDSSNTGTCKQTATPITTGQTTPTDFTRSGQTTLQYLDEPLDRALRRSFR